MHLKRAPKYIKQKPKEEIDHSPVAAAKISAPLSVKDRTLSRGPSGKQKT